MHDVQVFGACLCLCASKAHVPWSKCILAKEYDCVQNGDGLIGILRDVFYRQRDATSSSTSTTPRRPTKANVLRIYSYGTFLFEGDED